MGVGAGVAGVGVGVGRRLKGDSTAGAATGARARRPEGAVARHEADAASRLPLATLAFLEVLDGFLHDPGVDAPLAVGVAGQQAMVADDVDDARRSLAVVGNLLDGGVGEDAGVGRARDAQAVANILARLLGAEGRDVAAESHALLELAT